ncbi:hypothetical protein N7468_001560 [Penicillium chermesinum]|uniref:N-acetyltransferase domain-containing protein n=1 Tax=Penicillium chermesinum TaxID=63820 RepID=A0A9W9TX75_9EURO|nr:uncharacterized protein N7468_001560 [Penicillium chermesinum]KAJ5246577.1 hypothetical protein N7468_001560 [Penicillium chermesinum]KAJ6144846.1 hypothetical protein N7470_008741 [Penicillium chermesinum]
MIQSRLLDPCSISFVAVAPNSETPDKPLGYAQFTRVGNDEVVQRMLANRDTFWLKLSRWWFSWQRAIANDLWPDRSIDSEALDRYTKSNEKDNYKYWESPEMKKKYENRWIAQSVAVASAYQRKGIGRKLMAEVLIRAQEEQVVVGLDANEEGEKLFQSLGFVLRGRFSMKIGPRAGGIMKWTPAKTPRQV